MCGPVVKIRGPGMPSAAIIAPQLLELLVPLARIAKRGDAMTELPQRELRIVLDVEVRDR